MDFERVGRIGNVVLGGWLLLSAILFERTSAHALNAAVVGTIAAAVALVSLLRVKALHLVNVGLAIWLFFSLWALPGRSAWTVANDMVVATLMFGFAVIPAERRQRPLAGPA